MDQNAHTPRGGAEDPSTLENLKEWIDALSRFEPIDWQRFPELELYMDQVITFVNKQYETLSTDGERLLTPSMINNYVKDGVLPRPEKKKYSRRHLAMLFMICSLKSVLQLPEIDAMLRGLTEGCGIEDQYPVFSHLHGDVVKDVAGRVTSADIEDPSVRYLTALQLALEANVRRIMAVRLLSSLMPPPKDEK